MKHLSIYRQVAKSALMSWNGLSESEAEVKVQTQTFEQLENQVWATGSLNYAIEAIAKLLNMTKQKSQIANVVIDKENVTITDDQQSFLNMMKKYKYKLSGETQILYILAAIHDGWVKDNGKKFNQENREAKRYQHLPLFLIGWKEAKADLLFLAPIIKEMTGENINESELERAYNQHIATYLNKKGVDTKEKLVLSIMQGSKFYTPLTEQNTAQTKEVATAMAEKVLEVNPQVDVVLKSKKLPR